MPHLLHSSKSVENQWFSIFCTYSSIHEHSTFFLNIQNLALDRGFDTGLVILLFTMPTLYWKHKLIGIRQGKQMKANCQSIHYQSLCFPKIIIPLDKNKETVLLGCTEKSSHIDPPLSPLLGRGISGLVRLKASKSSMRSFNLEVGGLSWVRMDLKSPNNSRIPPTHSNIWWHP